jgi:DNA polymerase-1
MAPKRKICIIIDSHALIHRAYHALPRLTTPQGELTNAVFGFSSVLVKVLREHRPDYLVATFDVAAPTFRKEEYEEYKATRTKAPDDLYAQIPRVKEVLQAFNIPILEKAGFEADDVIGTVCHILEEQYPDVDALVVSGDMDTLQLVTKHTRVYTMRKGVQDTIVYDEKGVKERFGFAPKYLADYKGLRGDPSDNIVGVVGVGEKTASTLIQKFGTLEKMYAALEAGRDIGVSPRIAKLLAEQKDQALFSRMLATIRRDVPVDFDIEKAAWGGFDQNAAKALFEELSFRGLIGRLAGLDGFDEVDTPAPASSRREELYAQVEDAREAGLLSDQIYQVEEDLVDVVVAMEGRGVRVDTQMLNRLQTDIQKKLSDIESEIYKVAGMEFNINSPKQMGVVLFETLGISPKGIKKTPGKEFSTAADELEKIRDEHPVVALILQQRELQKMLSTYIAPLPDSVGPDGRIHSTLYPLGTTTGRLSSSNPNLQNIPIRGEWGAHIRESFIPDEGKVFLACDYSQMELRIVAHLAKDKNMIEAFQNGEDIHTRTASLVFGIDANEVTKDMRYRAKALNFGLIYGIGSRAFARSAGISVDEAKDFMDKYLVVFSGVAEYIESAKALARERGYAETLFGRKRFLPDLHSPNPGLRAFAERAAINMPAQGTAADIVKMAMVRAEKEFPTISLLLQIHDELLWEGEPKEVQKVQNDVQYLLEHIVELAVPLSVSSAIGSSWGALK